MMTRWLTAAALLSVAQWQQIEAAPAPPGIPSTEVKRKTPSPPKKPKPAAKPRKPSRTPKRPVPSKPRADIPQANQTASVWRGCLDSQDVPKLATGLGVDESRLEPLLEEQGVLAPRATCVPYVAATGGAGGTATAVFQRPEPGPDESPIVDLRKTADGITVTPGACDCPEPARRIFEYPVFQLLDRRDAIFASAPPS